MAVIFFSEDIFIAVTVSVGKVRNNPETTFGSNCFQGIYTQCIKIVH